MGVRRPRRRHKNLRRLRHTHPARPAQRLRRRKPGGRPPRVDPRQLRPLPAKSPNRSRGRFILDDQIHPRRRPRLASHRNQNLTRPQRPRNRALLLAPCQPRQPATILRLRKRQRRLPRRASADATKQLHTTAVLLLRNRRPPAHHHRHTRALQTNRPPRRDQALLPHARTLPQPRRQEHALRRLASRPRARPRHQLPQLRNPGSPQRRPPRRLLQHARPRRRPRSNRDGPPPPRRHRRLGHARTVPHLRRRRPRRTRHLERSEIPISTRRPHLVLLGIRPPHRRSALRLGHLERQRRHLVRRALPCLPAAHRPLRLAAHQLHRPRS